MTHLEELKCALDAAKVGTPQQSVESAIAVYHAAQSVIDAYTAIKDGAKALIGDVMAETGFAQYSTSAGKASVASASISVAYDAKALDVLCRANPQVEALLAPYRKETLRAGTLRITTK